MECKPNKSRYDKDKNLIELKRATKSSTTKLMSNKKKYNRRKLIIENIIPLGKPVIYMDLKKTTSSPGELG